MEDRRRGEGPWQGGNGPWRGWLVSLLIGIALAVFCLHWLDRRAAPVYVPSQEAVDAETAAQRSVGFEFSLRFRILLPGKVE